MKYGEQIIKEFDVEKDLEIWPNQHKKNYVIKLTLPEFCCLCPRSGYPDFATIYIDYIPDELVVELKAIKAQINPDLYFPDERRPRRSQIPEERRPRRSIAKNQCFTVAFFYG